MIIRTFQYSSIGLMFLLLIQCTIKKSPNYYPKNLILFSNEDLVNIAKDSFFIAESIIIRDSTGSKIRNAEKKKILLGEIGADYYGNEKGELVEIVIRELTLEDELLMIRLLEEHQSLNDLITIYQQLDCNEVENVLEDLLARDQAIRGNWEYGGELIGDVDETNLSILLQLYINCGLPDFKSLSENAKMGMFLVIQHHPEIQSKFYSFFKSQSDLGHFPNEYMALLIDRILVTHNKKQVYGTQLLNVGGVLKYDDIRDFKNLNTRRAKIGLKSFEKYLSEMEKRE